MSSRRAYFQAMQLPVWRLRSEFAHLQQSVVGAEIISSEEVPNAEQVCSQQAAIPAEISLEPELVAPPSLTAVPVVDEAPIDQLVESQTDNWTDLQHQVQQCQACHLSASRTQTVFGVGDQQADWLLIGEAPGAEEDRLGEPFVGRAGQLLTEMIFALGFERSQVYIANILKCRPPENRDPRPDEVEQCIGFLHRQIALIQPKIILAVGRVAAQNLLQTTTTIGKLRGQRHQFGPAKTPLVATYHPSYLLRSPLEKSRVWDDLLFAKSVIRGDS